MKILYAPDSYGGFLSAPDACARVRQRLSEVHRIPITIHPMTDGGEGALAVWQHHGRCRTHSVQIHDPLGDAIQARYLLSPELCLIESRHAVGLSPDKHAPMRASSAGLGELLAHVSALQHGPILLGLGGSAVVDVGLGMLQVLGLRMLDASGNPLPPRSGAGMMHKVARIEGRPPLQHQVIRALVDVQTPLHRSAALFGPQKGVHAKDLVALSAAMLSLAGCLNDWRIRHDRAPLPLDLPGGGAAGGLGFALACVLDAHLVPGARTVAGFTGLSDQIRRHDVIILGEGRLDPSSFEGKVAQLISQQAREADATLLALVGQAHDVPPPPLGPDVILCALDSGDRDADFDAAIDALADTLRTLRRQR